MTAGLNREGKKEVLGMWLCKSESSIFSMRVLTDLKASSVEDILITAIDKLNGFTQTIRSVFPESQTQICVVTLHQKCLQIYGLEERKEKKIIFCRSDAYLNPFNKTSR